MERCIQTISSPLSPKETDRCYPSLLLAFSSSPCTAAPSLSRHTRLSRRRSNRPSSFDRPRVRTRARARVRVRVFSTREFLTSSSYQVRKPVLPLPLLIVRAIARESSIARHRTFPPLLANSRSHFPLAPILLDALPLYSAKIPLLNSNFKFDKGGERSSADTLRSSGSVSRTKNPRWNEVDVKSRCFHRYQISSRDNVIIVIILKIPISFEDCATAITPAFNPSWFGSTTCASSSSCLSLPLSLSSYLRQKYHSDACNACRNRSRRVLLKRGKGTLANETEEKRQISKRRSEDVGEKTSMQQLNMKQTRFPLRVANQLRSAPRLYTRLLDVYDN